MQTAIFTAATIAAHTTQNGQQFTSGNTNGAEWQAETQAGKLVRLIVMYERTIIALYELGKWEYKPYKSWKNTVQNIVNHLTPNR